MCHKINFKFRLAFVFLPFFFVPPDDFSSPWNRVNLMVLPLPRPPTPRDYAVALTSRRPDVLTSRRHRRHRRPPTTEDTQIVSPDGFDISSSKRSKLNRKPDNMHFPQRLPSRFRIQWDGATRMGGWVFQRIQYIDIVFEQLNLNV